MRTIAALATFLLSIALLNTKPLKTPKTLLTNTKQILTKHKNKLILPNLHKSIKIDHNHWGIAHIYAKNAADLFFAQGFTAAQDRLFQIELWRRQSNGEMAEVFGADYLPADRFARLMKYRGDMAAE